MKNYKTSENTTLFEALKKMYPDSSNTTIRSLLKKRRVYVDNVLVVNAKEIIEKEKVISIAPIIQKIPYGIEMIFEDFDRLLVFNNKLILNIIAELIKVFILKF